MLKEKLNKYHNLTLFTMLDIKQGNFVFLPFRLIMNFVIYFNKTFLLLNAFKHLTTKKSVFNRFL